MDFDLWASHDEGALDAETGLLRFAAAEAANAELCAARAFEAEQTNASLKIQLSDALHRISKALAESCSLRSSQRVCASLANDQCTGPGLRLTVVCLEHQWQLPSQLWCPACSKGVSQKPIPARNLRKLLIDFFIAMGGTMTWEATDYMSSAQWDGLFVHVSREIPADAEVAGAEVDGTRATAAPANHED
ncbi:hypothetical protein BKA62DRAFT_677580 [Auriculariales sp. MPI-PUGE-AT-0066]|nr:hypothetical protein BKA62DRAFT_677580 [Auriculariales sp. MPI-PUGE-AT-0066]